MYKKTGIFFLLMLTALQISACGSKNCKAKDCDSEIYQDGYCKYHYYINQAENAVDAVEDGLKGLINGD